MARTAPLTKYLPERYRSGLGTDKRRSCLLGWLQGGLAFITGQCCGASWTGSVEMAACEHFVAEGEAR